jgi:hypothetical protein
LTAGLVASEFFGFYLSITYELLKEGGIDKYKKHYPGQIYVALEVR